ncbi:MAG: hypothetical protein HYZ83_01565 [Candidatus Omnitrophica bacterium]|nr:hypothetical protein [Candidatus Omnitrophota bacterium]
MKKILFILALFIVIMALSIFIAKDKILKAAVETGISTVTGFDTKISSIGVGLSGKLHIRELKIRNPNGFKKDVFADIPEIYVNLDLPAALKGKEIHIYEARLNIAEINIEKTPEGVTNISLISAAAAQSPKEKPAAQKPPMPFALDVLELTMRKVSYEDHSSIIPKKLAADLNVEKQVFRGIENPQALLSLILLKVFYGTTFGNLGIDPAMLQKKLTGALSSGEELLKQTSTVMLDTAGATFTKTTEVLDFGEAKTTMSGAATVAQKKITGIFGKIKSKAEEAAS